MSKKLTATYKILLSDIGALLAEERKKAFRQVNTILVETYGNIGSRLLKDLARSFYEKQCINDNWSVRESA